VTLEDISSGQKFVVLNVHDPADTVASSALQAQQERFFDANSHVQLISALKQRGLPIFFTGDFNNRYSIISAGVGNAPLGNVRQNLTYCILTKNGDMADAYDAASGKKGACPSNSAGTVGNIVDHIFVSNTANAQASNYRSVSTAPSNGSDVHQTVAVDITFGSSQSGTSGDWQWPVDKKWWDAYRSDFLGPHTLISGTFTSPYAKGVADDISTPPVGTPEYSMLTGKVIRTNLCGAGDGMMIESQVQGGTLDIAYGHGTSPRFNFGDTVQAGQQILSLNGVGCKVFGAHLHIDMSFNGKHICPQDVFLAMGSNQSPDLASLTSKGIAPCGR
jgi:murein DD-endopeptidase MepM/ murein hydrolase activator NlpD